MAERADKTPDRKSQAAEHKTAQQLDRLGQGSGFVDNRPALTTQQQLQNLADLNSNLYLGVPVQRQFFSQDNTALGRFLHLPHPAFVHISSQGIQNEPIVQRIATQITLEENNDITINIVGRPPNAYGSSAGDHLTAFSVRKFGLNLSFNKQNFWRAVIKLDELIAGIQDMPGFELVPGMEPQQHKKLLEAWSRMRTLREYLPTPLKLLEIKPDAPVSPFHLSSMQDLISTYLDVVELIPLSTINVATKFKAKTGKGKGESGPLNVLKTIEDNFAQGKESGVTNSEFEEAFLGVFDANTASLVGAELDEGTLKAMAPGLTLSHTPPDRLTRMIGHHIVTMEQNFPRTMAKLGDKEKLKQQLVGAVVPRMIRDWKAEIEYLNKRTISLNTRIQKNKNRKAVERRNATKQRREIQREITRDENEIEGIKKEIIEINKYIKQYTKEAPKVDSSGVSKMVIAEPERVRVEKDDDSGEVTPTEEEEEIEDDDQNELTYVGPSVQIRVDKSFKIVDIRFAGRSPSMIIGGGMGAHTTAWIAHLDRIRTALVGKLLTDKLLPTLKSLWAEAQGTFKNLSKEFTDSLVGKANREKAEKNYNSIKSAFNSPLGVSPVQKMSILQGCIREILNFLNNIPGASLEATDTGGKNEGRIHSYLLAFETGKQKQNKKLLSLALMGLLDIKVVKNDNKLRAVLKNHLEVISKAYPKSWAASGLAKITKNLIANGSTGLEGKIKNLQPAKKQAFDVAKGSGDSSSTPGSSLELSSFMLGKEQAPSKTPPKFKLGSASSGAKSDANPDYQYEDVDMYRILQTELAQLALPNITIVPPTDDMNPGQLTQRLNETNPGNRAVNRTILIPFNIGNYHWVGIVIVLGQSVLNIPPNAIVRYLDPLPGFRPIAAEVLNEIRAVFPGAEVENASRLLQIDGTSCGPLTIENLLRQVRNQALVANVRTDNDYTNRLRERHINLLQHDFPAFRDRQASGDTLTSSFDAAGYLSKKKTYTKKGTHRILTIAHYIRNLQTEKIKKPIVDAFLEISKLMKEKPLHDVSQDYKLLRDGFSMARSEASKLQQHNKSHPDIKVFVFLMYHFWHIQKGKLNESFDNLSFGDYDEMQEIANQVLGKVDLSSKIAELVKALNVDKLMLEKLLPKKEK